FSIGLSQRNHLITKEHEELTFTSYLFVYFVNRWSPGYAKKTRSWHFGFTERKPKLRHYGEQVFLDQTSTGKPVRSDSRIRKVAPLVTAKSPKAMGAGFPSLTTAQTARTSSR